MKLNDDLQNYLAQSSSKSKASLSSGIKGSDGLLTFWNSNTQAPNAAVVDFDNEPSATSDSGASGWFKSMRVPLLGGSQLSNSEINPPSRIARLCSCFPTLGHRQRLAGFGMSLTLGIVLFSLAAMNIPFLILRARKFALLFSMGSVSVVCSIGFLIGPVNYLTHFLSRERLVLSTTYLASLLATLYSSLLLQSTLLTVPFAIIQILAVVWILVSYIPGGQTGLRFMSSLFTTAVKKTVSQTLPV